MGTSLIDPTTTCGLSEYDDRTCRVLWRRAYSAAASALAPRMPSRAFLEGHGVELSGVAHDARVGAEDAVHVGVDLTDIGTQRGGHVSQAPRLTS